MNVYFTPCEIGPNAPQHQKEALQSLWSLSSKQHQLVDSPETADVILIGNLRAENWYASLRNHPVINKYPNRCFVVSETWELFPLLRGVYTNAHKKLSFRARFRSGSYALHHPDFKNPFIENYRGRAFEKNKTQLAAFTGRDCHPVRAAIFALKFRRPDIVISDTSNFDAFTHDNSHKAPRQKAYAELLESSKFSICPRGSGAASIRLFESMKMGVAPVIISDDWIFPDGPDWSRCAIIVREQDVGNLEDILVANEPRFAEIGRAAAEAFQRFFSASAYFDYLIGQVCGIKKSQLLPESVHWRMRNWKVIFEKMRRKALLKQAALRRRTLGQI